MNGFFGKITRAVATATVLAALAVGGAEAADKTVRVGYQKYGTFLLLKARGLFEKKLEPLGFSVAWTEFPGGPQLLEALNVGALDFGITGEAPPIFAQAAGAPLVYVGNEPPAPLSEAILVPKDSPIHSVAELKGKSVALNKGSKRPVSNIPTSRRSSWRRPTRAPRSNMARSTPGRSGTRSRPPPN